MLLLQLYLINIILRKETQIKPMSDQLSVYLIAVKVVPGFLAKVQLSSYWSQL